MARNYRHRQAEIDLITRRGALLVFVEVKTRSNAAFGHPEEFVDEKQAERILEAADQYIHEQAWTGAIRFDIISVMLQPEVSIHHFEDAFY